MIRLILNSIKREYRKSMPMFFVVFFVVCIVFSNMTAQFSQMEYERLVINRNMPNSQAEIIDVNEKQAEELRAHEGLESLILVRGYGKVQFGDGGYENMLEYNEKYFRDYNLKLARGTYPKYNNEIIISRSTLESNGYKVGDYIELRGNKLYEDKNGRKQFYNYVNKFKIVGFYDYPSEIATLYKYRDVLISSKNSISSVPLSYCGSISFGKGQDPTLKSAELSYELDSSREQILPNDVYSFLDEQVAVSTSYDENDKFFILIGCGIIVNIILLGSIESSRRQGLMRVVGMSKKNVFFFEMMKNMLIFIISSSIGVLFSILVSILLIHYIDYSSSVVNTKHAPLIVNGLLLLKVILPLLATNIVATIYSCKNMLTKTPIEQYVSDNKVVNKLVKVISLKKPSKKIMLNNLLNEKLFIVLSISIISFSGYMYLINYYDNVPPSVTNNELATYQKFDIKMYIPYNAYADVVGYSKKDVEKIAKTRRVDNVVSVIRDEGYMLTRSEDLTKEYKEQQFLDNADEIDIRYDLQAYDTDSLDRYIKTNGFIESGRQIHSRKDIPEVLIFNKFYSMRSRKTEKVLNNIKEGDILEIRIPKYINNGGINYVNQKVKVVGFLGKQWDIYSDTESFVPDIILSDNDFSRITERYKYNSVYISTDSKKDVDILKLNLKNRYADQYHLIRSEKEAFYDSNKLTRSAMIQKITVAVILMCMSCLNVTIGLIVSYMRNVNVFNTLSAVGGSKRYIQNITKLESMFFLVPGVLIGLIYTTIYSHRYFNYWKERAISKGIGFSHAFELPVKYIIIYILSVAISGCIAYFVVRRSIKSMKFNKYIN